MEIHLNDLPKYCNKIDKLLNNDFFRLKKDIESVNREFNDDKWADILSTIKKLPGISIKELDKILMKNDKKDVYYEKFKFYYLSDLEINNKIIDYQISIIRKNISGCEKKIIELGAGYGSKLLNVGLENDFHGFSLFAGELTNNGKKLIKALSSNDDLEVNVFGCNLETGYLSETPNTSNGLIFTSYAAHYADKLDLDFFKIFRKLGAGRVLHFEPIYELHDTHTLHGYICRKYIESNGYTKNLLSILREGESRNICKILSIDANVMGHATLPISTVAWEFNK
jgi:hypothetical protein